MADEKAEQAALGNLIRQKRQARGLSQEQLAQQLEVSRQAVAKWESGKGFPSAERLLYLGQVLDIPAEALLGRAEGKKGRPRHAGRIARWLLAAGMAVSPNGERHPELWRGLARLLAALYTVLTFFPPDWGPFVNPLG